jgi:hypothetical protein
MRGVTAPASTLEDLRPNMLSGELQVDIVDGAVVRVHFRGKSNHREPDVILRPLFADIFKRTVRPNAVIELHFEQLEFFNSSTITSIIEFVKELGKRKVVTRVTYDPDHRWQKVFFDAMGMLERPDGILKIAPVRP